MRPAKFSSESVEWYTPARYIVAARAVLGEIDLDPASCPKANEVVQAKQIYTAADDGLSREWRGRVWLNPPYGPKGPGAWCKKLIDEHRAGRVPAGILLVNAATDRKWFRPLLDFVVCVTDHRIKFATPSGTPQQPVYGNAFVYLGDAPDLFVDVFKQFGAVVGTLETWSGTP
jgi:ParB family chromosome partitioning protein